MPNLLQVREKRATIGYPKVSQSKHGHFNAKVAVEVAAGEEEEVVVFSAEANRLFL